MTPKLASLLCFCSLTLPALAGSPVQTAPMILPPPASEWQFDLTLPVWGAGISGDIGIAGFNPVGVEAGFTDILENLDMTAAMTLEARSRHWGFILDGMYLKASVGGETPGRLLNTLDVQVTQVLAEGAVTYRLLEGERGYLDLLAGVRYYYLGAEMHFDLDTVGVRGISSDLSNTITDRAVTVIQGEVEKTAARIQARLVALNLDERASAIRDEVKTKVIEKLLEEHSLKDIIDAIRDLTPADRERLREKIETSKEIIAANTALAQAVIQERAAAVVGSARYKAQKAVARAQKQLASSIESAIHRVVPEQVSGSKTWVDPFIGFRAKLRLTNKLYLAARGDIGGFGVGSDMTWNVFGGIGYQWNERFSTELGYRLLVTDYANGGFVYDMRTSGIYLGMSFKL